MARLLLIVLALLLPLQFSWGAVAGYCQHETTPPEARHVGHHAHEHPAEKAAKPSAGKADADCGDCHAASLTGLPTPASPTLAWAAREAPPAARPHRYPSAPQRAPDRPQWLRLV
ncbi:cation efflux protein, CzcI family [Roseateles sp. BYS96W]|uniref:Cation efflux protein, CzcI family n=1 Tax=Pelomonas nitida TaxID=3299027 RepID=A0ABW7G826_9BURK